MFLSSIKYPYIVVLKNQSMKAFNLMGFLLCIGSCLFFIKEFILTPHKNLILIIGIIILAALLIWNIFQIKKRRRIFFDRAYLMAAILWIKMPYMEWLLFIFMILGLLDRQIKFPIEIGFSEKVIVFNTLFKRKIKWTQISNVVLKDGIITIDFRNNHLLQREIEDNVDAEVSEEEFNEFCRKQLQNNLVAINM